MKHLISHLFNINIQILEEIAAIEKAYIKRSLSVTKKLTSVLRKLRKFQINNGQRKGTNMKQNKKIITLKRLR